MLINLNEAEVKFVLYAINEIGLKLASKFAGQKPVAVNQPAVRLTKSGRPAKKPGRKPGKKLKIVDKVAA